MTITDPAIATGAVNTTTANCAVMEARRPSRIAASASTDTAIVHTAAIAITVSTSR